MSIETASAPIQIFTSKVMWRLQKSAFDTPEGSRQFIPSKKFQASPDTKITWFLLLYPRGDIDHESSDYVSVYVNSMDMKESAEIKYRFGLIASDGTEKNVTSDIAWFDKAKIWWGQGEPRFIRRDKLYDPNQNLLRDNQVTIYCELEVQYWNEEEQLSECTLSFDFSEKLDSGEFSDAVLVVGGEEIKAHKLILCSGSPVFAAMFKYNTTENQTGRVLIEDLDIVGVKALLRYLYSGKVSDLKAIAEKVLPAADKYGVERLKNLCEKEITKKLTFENVEEMSRLAELHNAIELKRRVDTFLRVNAAEVAEQGCFWDLADSNQDLLREVFGLSPASGPQNSDRLQVERRKLNNPKLNFFKKLFGRKVNG